MPRATQPSVPDPRHEIPFWRTATFGWFLMAAVLFVGFAITNWLIKANSREQAVWKLEADPSLSGLVARLREDIAQNRGAPHGTALTTRAPVALWVGKVLDYRESSPVDGSEPTSSLLLTDATLLAGKASASSAPDRLSFSGKYFTFTSPVPRPAETWLISVWQDAEARPVIHSATRVQLR